MKEVDSCGKVHSWNAARDFVFLDYRHRSDRTIASKTKFARDLSYGDEAYVLRYVDDTVLVYLNDGTFIANTPASPKGCHTNYRNAFMRRLNQFGPRGWRFYLCSGKLNAFQHIVDKFHEVYHEDIGGKRLEV